MRAYKKQSEGQEVRPKTIYYILVIDTASVLLHSWAEVEKCTDNEVVRPKFSSFFLVLRGCV